MELPFKQMAQNWELGLHDKGVAITVAPYFRSPAVSNAAQYKQDNEADNQDKPS